MNNVHWTFWSCEDYQHPQVLFTSPHPELPKAPTYTYSTTMLHLRWHWWTTSKEDTEGGVEDRDGRKKEKVVTEKDRRGWQSVHLRLFELLCDFCLSSFATADLLLLLSRFSLCQYASQALVLILAISSSHTCWIFLLQKSSQLLCFCTASR